MLNKIMKTRYFLALSALLALAACQNITEMPEENTSNGKKVTVEIPVRVPDAVMGTKAFGDVPAFETEGLFVAVYEGGYRCEVVKAELDGAPTINTSTGAFEYNYSLTLTSSESKRNLHFISMEGFTAADAPFEESRIGAELYSEGGVDAYWQRVKLDKVSDVPAILKSDLGTVTMIRNFVKITLTKDDTNVPDTKFTLESYKVFNTPDRGHIAPYIVSGTSSGYVDGYDALDYDDACDAYPGKVPAGATYAGYTTADDGGATFIDADDPTYMYERPVPKDETAAFIIIKGYYEGSSTPCYYKINLQDDTGKYYALLRGFRFKINIDKVTGEGSDTVKAAIESTGSGDISTSLSFIDVTNISDGNCRIFVSTTSITTIKATTLTIKYKFYPSVSDLSVVANGETDVDVTGNTGIEVSVNEPEEEGYPSISMTGGSYNVTVHDETSEKDADGYNYITVQTTNHENIYKEQTITIRGRGTDGTIIQREIHIIVRPTLKLSVECPSTNNKTAMNNVTVSLGIEPDLPQSIFPLQFRIEADKLTLTPDNSQPNNNMPVESGPSANSGNPTFYFVKTVDYATYTAASSALTTVGGVANMVKISCYFKENTVDGSTDIYVSNDLFNLANCDY